MRSLQNASDPEENWENQELLLPYIHYTSTTVFDVRRQFSRAIWGFG